MYELILYLFMATLAVTVVIGIVFFAVALPFWRSMQQERDRMMKEANHRLTDHKIKL